MVTLKVKRLDMETGGLPVVLINSELAKSLDLSPMDRIEIRKGRNKVIAVVDVAKESVKDSEIGLFSEVWKKLKVKDGDKVEISLVEKPTSVKYIREKMDGEELTKEEIYSIIKDVVEDKLTDVELTAFVSACYISGMSLEETENLTRAIVDTGGKLRLHKRPILDKHSIGGVPGNRVTMVLVPTISSMGYIIPKTSSRAITSPSGTADTMEVLANVSFTIDELYELIKKNNGFIVWGGAINLAAADDKLIRVRHPLSLDPEGMMLASIVGKKYAVGATHVVFDLPLGEEAKLHSLGEARHLEHMFYRLTSRFGMKIKTLITDGSQPVGNGIGPSLEARDVLWLLKNDRRGPKDLLLKSALLTSELLKLVGKNVDQEKIVKYIRKGKPYKQMQKIIEAQGGDPKVKPNDLDIGKYTLDFKANKSGRIMYISNHTIAKIARFAGAPKDKGAGVYFWKKVGAKVRYGEKIFTVYSNSEMKLDQVMGLLREITPVTIE